jgi:hypothetical protein
MTGVAQTPAGGGLLERVIVWVKQRAAASRELAELRACSQDQLAELARDVGATSVEELVELVRRGPASVQQLSELAAILGIPLEDVRKAEPLLVRELEACCGHCGEKGRCRAELDDGTAQEHFGEFCPNAEALAALRR